ncbi:MAG: hypothetical protein U5N56_02335 [Candidatus Marinimicrobia bacterium]|nr:hypothetical protein [Candidatus Neomarinimicrobiota bacterium]
MRKKICSLYIILLFMSALNAGTEVYFSADSEIYSRYIFRGSSPAGPGASASLGVFAYFPDHNIGVAQSYLNSLADISVYHESLTMLSYYHYFNERLTGSAGLRTYLFPGAGDTPPLTLELHLRFSDTGAIIPYSVETYFDIVVKSWHWRFSAAHTFDTVLPVQIKIGSGINALSHRQFGEDIPAGFSDIYAALSTYISLNNWQFTPKISYIVSLNKTMRNPMLFQASFNTAYSF